MGFASSTLTKSTQCLRFGLHSENGPFSDRTDLRATLFKGEVWLWDFNEKEWEYEVLRKAGFCGVGIYLCYIPTRQNRALDVKLIEYSDWLQVTCEQQHTQLLFTPMSITPLIGMEDAHIVLNVSCPSPEAILNGEIRCCLQLCCERSH